MPTNLAAPPLQTPLIEPPGRAQQPTWLITKVWANWIRSLTERSEDSAYQVQTVRLEAQTASIGLTSLIADASGLYRVSYRFRVTTAAGVSSSLQVNIVTTDGAVVVTQSSAAYTGNSTGAPQSGTFIVRADAASPLQYEVVYASNPGAAMAYEVEFLVEAL